jgi:UDP-N-acetylbacillosamine N-acetyltransferase
LILGLGGTGRELADLLAREKIDSAFLDDVKTGANIPGKIKDWPKFSESHKLLSALGSYRSMKQRRIVLSSLPLANFSNFVSPLALVGKDNILGSDLVIFPFSAITVNCKIGDHVLIYHRVITSHDCQIGSYSILSNSCTISGNVIVGENSYIGAGSVVLEGRRIGSNCIIAAGATVTCDVPDGTIYYSKNNIKINSHA